MFFAFVTFLCFQCFEIISVFGWFEEKQIKHFSNLLQSIKTVNAIVRWIILNQLDSPEESSRKQKQQLNFYQTYCLSYINMYYANHKPLTNSETGFCSLLLCCCGSSTVLVFCLLHFLLIKNILKRYLFKTSIFNDFFLFPLFSFLFMILIRFMHFYVFVLYTYLTH